MKCVTVLSMQHFIRFFPSTLGFYLYDQQLAIHRIWKSFLIHMQTENITMK